MENSIQANPLERLAKLRAELRIGLMLGTDWGSFAAIEHLSEARYRALQENGPIFAILSRQRALDLQFSHDPSRPAVLRLPKDYRFGNLKSLADPALDLDYPGKGPLAQGELDAQKCDSMLEFCRQSRTLPAIVFTQNQFEVSSQIEASDWTMMTTLEPKIERVSNARVPLKLAKSSQLHVFRDLSNDSEHYAIIIGGVLSKKPVVRLHSACFTGDCLGSLKCDCGPQLETALKAMNETGGILLYLSQEGRGIGLPNKIRAYHLQDQGFDTVDANLKLGFRDDQRDFRVGAEILRALKISQVELMTNNPRKVDWLERSGIEVVNRIPIKIAPNPENQNYLATKSSKERAYSMKFEDLVVGKWGARFMGMDFPVSIGRGGIGEKRGEGDNITPIGIFKVETWLKRIDRVEMAIPSLRPFDGWSDDASKSDYNQLVKRPYAGSHERLYRADNLYDIIGVLNYNRNPIIAGKGSAIFIHAWRRPRFPTEGCIAFAPKDLRFIVANWAEGSKVIIQ